MTSADDHVPWYYKPVGITLLTIFVLGPFALPLVRRSPVIGPRGRSIGTALILAYTLMLVWQIWVAWRIAMALIPQS
jgi:hypothetical protein